MRPASSATPDAHHGHEHHGHDGEAGEVVDERREEEPDPVRAQQALDLGGLLVDLEVVLVELARAAAPPPARPTRRRTPLGHDGRRLGDVVGDADVEGGQHRRQHDHEPAQAEEDDGRVRAPCSRPARCRRASAARASPSPPSRRPRRLGRHVGHRAGAVNESASSTRSRAPKPVQPADPPGIRGVGLGGAGDVDVRPRMVADQLHEEEGGGDGPRVDARRGCSCRRRRSSGTCGSAGPAAAPTPARRSPPTRPGSGRPGRRRCRSPPPPPGRAPAARRP